MINTNMKNMEPSLVTVMWNFLQVFERCPVVRDN